MSIPVPRTSRLALILGLTLTATSLTGCLSGTPGPAPATSSAEASGESNGATPSDTGSQSPAPESPSTTAQPAGPPATGPHNDGDVNFTASLLANFEESVKTVQLAQAQSKNDKLIALSSMMGVAQSKQLPILRGWLKGFGGTAADAAPPAGADLTSLTDAAFDKAWVARQLQLHDKTIAMCTAVLKDGKNPQVVGHAKRVLTIAQREKAQLVALK